MPDKTATAPVFPLQDLWQHLEYRERFGNGNPDITGISCDSRLTQPGDIFVAIKGHYVDGHCFIPAAIAKGAAAIVVETLPDIPVAVPLIKVNNSRLALATLAAAFYGHPASHLCCAGVTGSTGKTTTTFLLNAIFCHAGLNTGLLGTICHKVGNEISPSDVTTPEPITLHKLFHTMVTRNITHTAMEVSSHSLCQERVAGVPFAVAVFTNLSPEHLNYHKSLAHYLASKAKLFTHLDTTAWAVLNVDEQATRFIASQTKAQVFTFGTATKADLVARDIKLHHRGSAFTMVLTKGIVNRQGKLVPPGQWPIKLSLLGRHNISNALGAAGAALALGIDPITVARGLEGFAGVPRRLQLIYRGPFTILDDFGHNEGSLRAIFNTIGAMKYNRLIIVNYLKGSRGVEANEVTAQHIASVANRLRLAKVISTRSDSHVIAKNKVQPEEEAAFAQIIANAGIPITTTGELPAAIDLGLKSVTQGDLLLLLGPSGMDAGAGLVREYLGINQDTKAESEGKYAGKVPAAAALI